MMHSFEESKKTASGYAHSLDYLDELHDPSRRLEEMIGALTKASEKVGLDYFEFKNSVSEAVPTDCMKETESKGKKYRYISNAHFNFLPVEKAADFIIQISKQGAKFQTNIRVDGTHE